MECSDPRKIPRTLWAAPVLLGLLLFHFTMVGLHVVPPNPVSLKARPFVDSYIFPFFGQQWELFAPSPGGKNDTLHVRCRFDETSDTPDSGWFDVTTPIIEAHRKNRMGQAERMLPAYQPVFAPDRTFERRAIRHLRGPDAKEASRILDEEVERTFEDAKRHVQRLASAACKRRFSAQGIRTTRVEARQVQTAVRPFGARGESSPITANALTLPIMPYVDVDL